MKSIFLSIFFYVVGTTASVSENGNVTTAFVINHEFCLSCFTEDQIENKVTLEELQTWALLKDDPRADLPSSFTICLSSMTTSGREQLLLIVLGKDGNQWLQSGKIFIMFF